MAIEMVRREKPIEESLARERAIGRELRQVFGRIADEPTPEFLQELARKLDARIRRQEANPRTAKNSSTDEDR